MKVPRLSPAQMEHMEKETMEMLRNYIIQFSDSEWATRPVFAKKNGRRTMQMGRQVAGDLQSISDN